VCAAEVKGFRLARELSYGGNHATLPVGLLWPERHVLVWLNDKHPIVLDDLAREYCELHQTQSVAASKGGTGTLSPSLGLPPPPGGLTSHYGWEINSIHLTR